MIERLNFYDVYGYLIPGLIFLAFLWFPYTLAGGASASVDWSSALLALVFGYVLGHLIQGLAIAALPSGRPRYPSDILLDDGDTSFSPEVKSRLVNRILLQFDIDVRDATNLNADVLRKRRQDTFMLCRRTLIQKGVASYAEQFEGMYALMRGVAAACILGFGYYLGLLMRALGAFSDETVRLWVVSGAGVIGLIILIVAALSVFLTTPYCKRIMQRGLFWLIGAWLFLLPGIVTSSEAEWFELPSTLAILCFVLGLVSLRCYGAYQEFSRNFAVTVYRDFCAL